MYSDRQIRSGLKAGRFEFTDIGLEKRCSRCGEMWPADKEFYFLNSSGRFRSECIGCTREICSIGRIKRIEKLKRG